MKLYNKTKCPVGILKPLLIAAGKSIGVRMANVVVKVTQGRGLGIRGNAMHGNFVYAWHLRNLKCRKNPNCNNLGRMIETDGGWIELIMPRLYSVKEMECWPETDAVNLAKTFYKVAQHEWAHIKDNQLSVSGETPRTLSGRRVEWCYRPCEQYAVQQVKQAEQLDVTSSILELAKWLENNRKPG